MRGDQKCSCACHWNWSWLNGAFGKSNISVSDIDGVIERHGHFLFIEAKHTDDVLSVGQQILFEQLSRKPDSTLVIVYGERDEPVFFDVCKDGIWFVKRCSTDRTDFYNRVLKWFQKANSF